MSLHERDWFSKSALMERWGFSSDDIEYLFETGRLLASYRFGKDIEVVASESGTVTKVSGIFTFVNYVDIEWNDSGKGDIRKCVLCRVAVDDGQEERDRYTCLTPMAVILEKEKRFAISKEKLIVTRKNVISFETRPYTQEEAAALLGKTTTDIIKMLFLPPDAKDSLTPYVYLNGARATKAGRYKALVLEDYNGLDGIKEPNTDRDVTLTGYYSVEGIQSAPKTEVMKDLILSFGGKSRLLLHKGVDTFFLQDSIRVKQTKLFVSRDEIDKEVDGNRNAEPRKINQKSTRPNKIHDVTGRQGPYSLMTTIRACLQGFYDKYERKPGGKSAVGEFVTFIDGHFKAKSKESFMERIVDLKPISKGNKPFIQLTVEISEKDPKGKHWHGWRTFENQFGKAMRNFIPQNPPSK